jgi:hypothetical protein
LNDCNRVDYKQVGFPGDDGFNVAFAGVASSVCEPLGEAAYLALAPFFGLSLGYSGVDAGAAIVVDRYRGIDSFVADPTPPTVLLADVIEPCHRSEGM